MDLQAHASYGWISARPYVLCEGVSLLDHLPLDEYLPAQPVARLLWPTWHLSECFAVQYYRRLKTRRPMDYACWLCNDTDLLSALHRAGVPAVLCSRSALLDERIFTLQAQVIKRYDAVYTARMAPWKRHALACEVSRLLLIGGVWFAREDSTEYQDFLRGLMPDANFAYDEDEPAFSPQQVNDALSLCRVGLCLSAAEGAMYASVEYLLAGLAVVSTRSVGGRALWYESEFARIVDDEPMAIAGAVNHWVTNSPSPQAVRDRTLARMREHRNALFEVVDAIYARAGLHRSYAREFPDRFFNKLSRWRPPAELMQHVDSDCAGDPW